MRMHGLMVVLLIVIGFGNFVALQVLEVWSWVMVTVMMVRPGFGVYVLGKVMLRVVKL